MRKRIQKIGLKPTRPLRKHPLIFTSWLQEGPTFKVTVSQSKLLYHDNQQESINDNNNNNQLPM